MDLEKLNDYAATLDFNGLFDVAIIKTADDSYILQAKRYIKPGQYVAVSQYLGPDYIEASKSLLFYSQYTAIV